VTPKRWIIVAAVLGSGIVFLDSTVVSVALPRIGRDLPRTFLGVLEGQSYVYYGYLLTLSALLVLAGALTDFYGRRRMFVIGLIGFGATSALCGIAPSMELLVLFRILQGAAGALLVPGSLALLTANFAGEEQGRAFGLWAGASGAVTVLGPLVGGLLVDTISWRVVFLINLPLVAIGEQFTVGFGAEPQLQVQRQMIDKARTMQGGNQVLKYEYRILVNSYKPDRVKLQVWDRLPLAENETMGVSLVKTSPEVSKDPLYAREDRPHNLLRWDLEVEPATNGEKAQTIQYEFKLELDKQMTIGSFQSK